jgi:polyisoprenoid-binding protein YceI
MSWKIDSSHTSINFSAKHMMISTVRGEFTDVSGAVEFDPANPVITKASVQIGVDSLSTRDEKRDGHLKSADFFDAANHPFVTFESKGVTAVNGNNAKLIGDLTIRGVTKEVALNVEYAGMQKSPWGATSAGFTATTQINREDWGLTWNVPLELGGVLVSKDIKLEIDMEIVKQ